MRQKKVFIIVLNYKNGEGTISCIKSLEKLDYENIEIVIVDNNSDDKSGDLIHKKFPHMHYIQTGENLGYSGGNNIGIRYALDKGANYIWILNPDTLVEPNTLVELLKGFAEKSVGIVCPKIYYQDDKNKVWFVDSTLDIKSGLANHKDFGLIDQGQFNSPKELEWATGASLLIRSDVFKKIGLFDPNYFLFFEDVDFSVRTKNAGFTILFQPKAHVYHTVGGSVGKGNPRNEFYKTRNRLYFIKKFNSQYVFLHELTKELILTSLKSSKAIIKSQNRPNTLAHWQGIMALLTNTYGIKKS